ncbi:MAG: amidase [Bacillota bacterium]
MISVLDMDASTLAIKIRSGEITSLDATSQYINHIKKVNPALNCVVENRFEKAEKEAALCDRILKSGKAAGRLFGVPVSIKEAFNVERMKTTGGLSHRKGKFEKKNAVTVERLRTEGAVILCKTNTPTLCFCQETDNKLYGRTNNPWDPSRTAGGSSGGEAALIAVGGAAVGLGSDIGGSIRFPSHFNGVVGFKSGWNQVPQEGHFPHVTDPFQERMVGFGALAKSVSDARLVNEIISGKVPEKKDLSGFSVCIPPKHPRHPLGAATAGILEKIRESLGADFHCHRDLPPHYGESSLLWQQIMSIDGAREISRLAFGERPDRPVLEYLKEVLTGRADLHRYASWAIIGARLFKPGASRIREMGNILESGGETVNRHLDERILIMPVYHVPAQPHTRVYRQLFSARRTFLIYMPYVAYANVWGLPSLTVPAGEDENGLPIGIQIISRVGNEDAVFQMGNIIEERFRGYVRCKKYD